MRVATVDLDDTLMRTGRDYDEAVEHFGDFVEREYDIDPDHAIEVANEIDRSHLDDMGLSMDRFPTSFRKALAELADNPPEEHLDHAESIAREAYKSREEYAKRGYMEGAWEMLDLLKHKTDEMHLITAGVPELQERKIKALRLNETFDECHVVPMDSKCGRITELREISGHSHDDIYHIGNSETSDVQAALRAEVRSVYLPLGQWRGTSGEDYNEHDSVHVYGGHGEFNAALRNGWPEEEP